MNDNIVVETQKVLDSFKGLSKNGVSVDVQVTEVGQFKVALVNKNKAVVVLHGWGNSRVSYSAPGTIDIVFFDEAKKEKYVIYMTECDLGDFPDLLKTAILDSRLFFEGRYSEERPKWWELMTNTYINFENDGDQPIYRSALKTKDFQSFDDFLGRYDKSVRNGNDS